MPQPTNLWQGQIRPKYIRRTKVPIWQTKTTIGLDGKVFTVAKVWVHEPTFEFPQVGIFLSLNNGNGSCFAKCNLEDFTNLVNFFTEASIKLAEIYPALQVRANQLDEAISQLQKQQDALTNLRAISEIQNNGGGQL